MAVNDAVAELVRWQLEHNAQLPVPEVRIAAMEQNDVICELWSGAMFRQRHSWQDFANRWVMEMARRGQPASEDGLAAAIYRTGDCGWSMTFCRAVAFKTLPEALSKLRAECDAIRV